MKITAAIITYNEESNIRDAIQSVEWADEVLVVDSESTDRTCEIAEEMGARVISKPWPGFSTQKQFATDQAANDWIFSLDADERVSPELRQEIAVIAAAGPNADGYSIPRLSFYMGKPIRHSGWYPDYVTRLYPRERASYGEERVHEKLHYSGEMREEKLTGDLLHYTYRDLNHYLVKSAHYAQAWSQQRYEKGKKASLLQAFIHGVGCFVKMYLVRAGFLDGRQGLLLALLSAHSTFVKYADLWVRYQPAKEEKQR